MPMTPAERADYERAAVALKTHEVTPRGAPRQYQQIANRAWWRCYKVGLSTSETDLRAARLLRECLEKGERLP